MGIRGPEKKSNGRVALYIVLLLVAVVAMLGIKRCSYPTSVPQVETGSGGDSIDVGIEYGPMTYYIEGDSMGGFSYDLLRELALRDGLILKFHPIVTVTEALKGLDSGRYDIVVASVPLTESIREHYAATHPVYIDRQLIVQRKDSTGVKDIESQLDLGGKLLYVVADSPVKERIRNLSSEIGEEIGIAEEGDYGNEQLVIMVATGEIDYAVVNERTALRMLEFYDNIDVSTAVSFNQFHPWLLRMSDSLLCRRVDSIMSVVKTGDFYKKLAKRYDID